ncbi:MAG TPA: CapA family protein, partial [Anaeromyxobacter sp.]|nr:CapA family protein [Anaeromyxobacter sp.]
MLITHRYLALALLIAGLASGCAHAGRGALAPPPPPPPPTPTSIPTSTPTAAVTPAGVTERGPITIAAVGDVMLGTTFPDETGGLLPPEDGKSLLAEVTPVLSAADLAFANLEGPLADGGTSEKCARSKPG